MCGRWVSVFDEVGGCEKLCKLVCADEDLSFRVYKTSDKEIGKK